MRKLWIALAAATALGGCAAGGPPEMLPFGDDGRRPDWMPVPQDRYPRQNLPESGPRPSLALVEAPGFRAGL